ncbi:hypothetical protein ACN28S_36340 [Cystobacter fuscus]
MPSPSSPTTSLPCSSRSPPRGCCASAVPPGPARRPLTLVGLALLLGTPRGGLADPQTALLGGASALFFAANVLSIKEASRAFSPLAINSLHAPLSALVLLLVFGSDALPPPWMDACCG